METRETMAPVPAGHVRTCDGIIPDELRAIVTVYATGTGAMHGYPTVTLAHVSRGYVNAGSTSRWDEARWSVTYWLGDEKHGRNFLEGPAARDYFDSVTDTQKVSARRQQDAMLEDTVYRPAREAKARAAAELDAKAAAVTFKQAVAMAHAAGVPVYRKDRNKRDVLARIESYSRQDAD